MIDCLLRGRSDGRADRGRCGRGSPHYIKGSFWPFCQQAIFCSALCASFFLTLPLAHARHGQCRYKAHDAEACNASLWPLSEGWHAAPGDVRNGASAQRAPFRIAAGFLWIVTGPHTVRGQACVSCNRVGSASLGGAGANLCFRVYRDRQRLPIKPGAA